MPTPLNDLALASAADVYAAADFIDLLSRQAPMPTRTLTRGFGQWLLCIREGREWGVVENAADARAEVATHAYAAELTALIDTVTGFVRNLPSTRTAPMYKAIAPTAFTPGGGGAASGRKVGVR